MPDATQLAFFVLAGLALNVTPGPDTLYIVGRATAGGARDGAIAALGIGAGCLVHILAAAIGLSALLATSANAFTIVKWIGAAWLVWIGIGMLRGAGKEQAAAALPPAPAPARRVFVQGFLTNVLNPKVALFFLAFVPQFIDPASEQKALAFIALGLIFDVNGTIWNLFVGVTAGRAARALRPRVMAWIERSLGVVMIALGVRLAFDRSA